MSPQPIPGLEVVGCGVYLRPYNPFELKNKLFEHTNSRSYFSPETAQTYEIPNGYEVNTSPPLPSGQTLNHVTIEESFERFQKQFEMDFSVAVSNVAFSVDASASVTSQLRNEQEAYYAVRSSFIALWSVYLPDVTAVFKPLDGEIPFPFDHDHRAAYEKFFERHGTHFIKRAWVGGKAALTFTVEKSSNMTKGEIHAGIKASYAGDGGGMNTKMQTDKEQLLNNSECTVFGKGGNESQLAAMSSLDEASYNNWLASIKKNPQTIEFEVLGIWTLIDNPDKAAALAAAYREATTFKPISAVFSTGKNVYFLRGDRYIRFDLETVETDLPKLLRDCWPSLKEHDYERIDAALRGDYLRSAIGEDLSSKLFLFKHYWCIRLDLQTGQVDPGYPKRIEDEWPGIAFEHIDAAFNAGPEDVYFFSGGWYSRFNLSKQSVDPGYPQRIAERWVGVTFDRVDGVFYAGNGKVLFFRDDQHLRYDMVNYRTDPGYPKAIVGSYVEDWKFFD